jgi:hypothetical protein
LASTHLAERHVVPAIWRAIRITDTWLTDILPTNNLPKDSQDNRLLADTIFGQHSYGAITWPTASSKQVEFVNKNVFGQTVFDQKTWHPLKYAETNVCREIGSLLSFVYLLGQVAFQCC